jgi:LacI family transcriptional regulator
MDRLRLRGSGRGLDSIATEPSIRTASMATRPNRDRVTLAQVAERAGVSPGAVSQVLNEHPKARISAGARERISRAVDELGYRPNMVARSLRMARSATFGFISDSVTTTRHATGILLGALRAAEQVDHLLLITETGGDAERERRAVESLLDRAVDGIVFAAMKSRHPITSSLPDGVPHVNVNLARSGSAVAVLPDEFDAGRTAVSALVDAGHTDGIVLIGHDLAPGDDPALAITARRRLEGIAFEMQLRDLRFAGEFPCEDWQPALGREAAESALGTPGLTALLCLNDRIAFGAYQTIATRGWRVAEDVSIVSFDDDEFAPILQPALTTIALPHERMGATAIELLTAGTPPVDDVLIPTTIRIRDSIGRPRSR